MSPEEYDGPVSESFKDAPEVYLASTTSAFTAFPVLQTRFNTLYKQAPIKALQSRAIQEGFKPVPVSEGKNALFGMTSTFKASDGKTAKFNLAMHSYGKPGAKDQAAIVTMTIQGGDKSETYHCLLVAPDGDFEKAEEYTLDAKNAVIKANSWWSRFVKCLRKKCATVCLGAVVTCSGAWAAYLWCLVAACGGCVLKCVACATCHCRWWCKWAVGCCEE